MTTIGGNVGNLVAGGTFYDAFHQTVQNITYNREVLAAWALDARTVGLFREIHVETPGFSEARAALQQESAVALIGPRGCGRRTSGVVLLAGLGIITKTVVLEP
jgi:hypothetical protein